MRRLKILIVHERFPPDFGGGGEYIVLQTARQLLANGHDVRVLVAGDPALTEFEGVPTQRLPVSRQRMLFATRAVLEAAADVDLIYAFTNYAVWPAWSAARQLGKPLVIGVLALFDRAWLDMRGPWVGRLFRFAERRMLSLPAQSRIFLSQGSLELAAQLGLGSTVDAVAEPGVDLHLYQPGADKDCVLFSGKLDVRKGIGTLLQVARLMPGIPFRVVGWGPQFDRLRQQAPANVEFVLYRDNPQLAQEMARARVFLFPTKIETFGLVVVEAMAAGCAVISTAPVPFEGIRLPGDDLDAACRALSELWADPQRCAAIGRANHQIAQQFNWPACAAKLERTFEPLVATGAAVHKP